MLFQSRLRPTYPPPPLDPQLQRHELVRPVELVRNLDVKRGDWCFWARRLAPLLE